MHESGYKGKKPAGQMHMTKKPTKKPSMAKGTMGMGKVKLKASGAMGKHQSTGTGEAF